MGERQPAGFVLVGQLSQAAALVRAEDGLGRPTYFAAAASITCTTFYTKGWPLCQWTKFEQLL